MRFFSGMMRKRKLIIAVLCTIALFLIGDYYIGQKQESIIREREAKKQRLERLAFYMVFPDIQDAGDIAGSPENYDVTLKVDVLSDEPVYATYPETRAYVQTGTFWTEVPIREKEKERHEQIIKLEKGQHIYKKIITVKRDIKYTFYQMYGYMHVRVHISMFVVPQSVFKEEEVIERVNDVYMYLKPYFISDQEILKQAAFSNNKVPTMIPMPPH
ncbi:MAG: hypothetical protein M1147_07120 [Nitrospirae bacterium]|nr:hypothetical protein [Nitrospirota bacterium]MCL5977882.1 hypothetical protein [Nitrospirota bacterium]